MARSKKPLTIEIEKPSKGKLEKDGIEDWPIWEKEISTFDWHYDEKETCYILEGKLTSSQDSNPGVPHGFKVCLILGDPSMVIP